MRLSLSKVLMLSAALALVPATVNAQPDLPLPSAGDPSCFLGLTYPGMSMNFDWCWGSYAGNNTQHLSAILGELNTFDPGTWTALETVNVGGTGAYFSQVPGAVQGTLMFSPMVGPFAIALKGSQRFSFFYYANTGGGAVSSVPFNMAGVSIPNPAGNLNALSHATLYSAGSVVPEPSTVILLGTGLLGLFGVEYRRRKKKA
ncbi:MAG: PEP-CTERM sorting domain-containing protein [Gemmatimonadetes bacterium]|nr:PEP-CTERM sorting domain-containing protein [Gemmatimonadota bacterium]